MSAMGKDRKKEIVELCLDLFIEKGLYETSTRDLSKAMNLQNAGLYYYFSSKDEVVISCAEEAAIRLENELICPAIVEMDNPDKMVSHLKKTADVLSPLMQFLSSVCSTPKYREFARPLVDKLSLRYKLYAKKFANKLECDLREIEPYVYIGITAVSNYMIFGDDSYIIPQMNLIKQVINRIKEENLR